MNYTAKFYPLPSDGVCGRKTVESDGRDPVTIDPYIFDDEIAITVDAAFATRRPLLISGPPGCGKSRLAETIADLKGWHYIGKTLTSRTRIEDLTVEMDHLRRLHDAHKKEGNIDSDWAYYMPGIFWWALNSKTAKNRGAPPEHHEKVEEASFPGLERRQEQAVESTVILLDEIDKAEPDLPNDLLELLDRGSFDLPNGQKEYRDKAKAILTVITTNGERELPLAFLRRCVHLELTQPPKEALIRIAVCHFAEEHTTESEHKQLVKKISAIVEQFDKCRRQAKQDDLRVPGTSELLDAIRASIKLKIPADPDNHIWEYLQRAIISKHPKKLESADE
ncbi:MAG: MoxR family ATPase [Candidatus Sedimenticola sp. (ex Thyasira tokunagai)]